MENLEVKPTYTPRRLAGLPEEERRPIEEAIRQGEVNIVFPALSTGSERSQNEVTRGNPLATLAARLAWFDFRTWRALREARITAAERIGGRLITEGNLQQLEDLRALLETIKRQGLWPLIEEKLASMGVSFEDIKDPTVQMRYFAEAIASLTVTHREIQTYEEVYGNATEEAQKTLNTVVLAETIGPQAPRIQNAIIELRRVNTLLTGLIEEHKKYTSYTAQKTRHQLAERGLISVSYLSGLLGGIIAGLVGGITSFCGYAGQQIQETAQRFPTPIGGGLFGAALVGLTYFLNNNMEVGILLDPKFWSLVGIGFGIGALGLPAVAGIVKAGADRLKQR